MLIRLAAAKDCFLLPAIERLGGQVFRTIGMGHVADGDVADVSFYRPLMVQKTLWVADDENGLLCGFAACEIMERILFVHELSVALTHQKRGIGRALMRTAMDDARARKLSALALRTFRDVVWNAPFYRSLGFVEFEPPEIAALMEDYRLKESRKGLDVTTRCTMALRIS
ncbi:MAG: GNAT family N-acetyltransferase [Proteobacteria bacterium]|nr:GNAT family N-acetyltransferase [Pseudomonadota bacterium]